MGSPEKAQWVRAGVVGGAGTGALVAQHTWMGESDHYTALADAMGCEILSILPPSPDDGPMPRRVEQWVDHHQTVLETLPVEPPYRFVGWSFAGVVAIEMARRLRDTGHGDSFVGMIDTIRPRLLPLSTREYVWFHLSAALAMPDEQERIAYLKGRGLFLLYRRFPKTGAAARNALVRVGRREPLGNPKPKPTEPAMVSVHTSYLNYRGDPVPFPVSIYATAGSTRRSREPALRWASWLHAGYELTDIPGAHFTMFDPEHVGALGDAIRMSLARYELR